MPRVDERNAYVTKREGAILTVGDTFAGASDIYREYITEVDPDADFYCNGIIATSIDGVSLDYTTVPGWKIQIIDIRTGFNLTFPFVRFGFFKAFPRSGIAGAERPLPSDGSGPFKPTSTIIQPYCFTRNGAIRTIVDTTGAQLPNAQRWQISYLGWKEYQYASR